MDQRVGGGGAEFLGLVKIVLQLLHLLLELPHLLLRLPSGQHAVSQAKTTCYNIHRIKQIPQAELRNKFSSLAAGQAEFRNKFSCIAAGQAEFRNKFSCLEAGRPAVRDLLKGLF
jgi:hypothetical protein